METQQKDDEYFRNSSVVPNATNEITESMEKLELSPGNSVIPFPTLNNFCKADFDVIELLGKGAYAKVVKAMYLKTKEVKAIKIIDRHFIERVN
jgi:serine/threonine protein kinase